MQHPQTSRIAVAICASFLIVGVFVVVTSWYAYFTDARIERLGARAEGIVLKKEVIRSADGDSDFSITYQFQLPSGQRIDAEKNLPKDRWQELRPGAPIVVLYSEAEPRRNFPAGGGVTSILAPVLVSVVFGGLVVLGGLLLHGLYRPRRA